MDLYVRTLNVAIRELFSLVSSISKAVVAGLLAIYLESSDIFLIRKNDVAKPGFAE